MKAIRSRLDGFVVAVDMSVWVFQAASQTRRAVAGIFQANSFILKVVFERVRT